MADKKVEKFKRCRTCLLGYTGRKCPDDKYDWHKKLKVGILHGR